MEFSINKIVTFVVLIIVGLLLIQGMIGEGGWLSDLKEIVLDDFDLGIGLEKLEAEDVGISDEHEQEIEAWDAAIDLMLLNETPNQCFYYWGGFSSFKDDVEIILSDIGDDVGVTIMGGAGLDQTYKQYKIEEIDLCVISGSDVTENFYNKFLNRKNSETIDTGYYQDVNTINIKYLAPWDGYNENTINYGSGDMYFQGDGWLFKAEDNKICFFPSDTDFDSRCSYDSNGLQTSCFAPQGDFTKEDPYGTGIAAYLDSADLINCIN